MGAAAMVPTPLFLVTPLRQNTKSLDQTRRANISQLDQFRAQMPMGGVLRKVDGSGLHLANILGRIHKDGFESLSGAEKAFLVAQATADAVRLDNGLFQHRNGFSTTITSNISTE